MQPLPVHFTETTTPSLALSASCGYTVDGERVVIDISEIRNNRPIGDLSGTLSLELWALPRPYTGGDFSGVPLAGTRIGEILGQHLIPHCRYDLVFQAPPPGEWHMVLMLREWTAAGYVTRDHVQFAVPYRIEPDAPLVHHEADAIISVDFDPAKRNEIVDERREAGIEPTASHHIKSAPRAEMKAPPEGADANADAIRVDQASRAEIAAPSDVVHENAESIAAEAPVESAEEPVRASGTGARLLAAIRRLIRI